MTPLESIKDVADNARYASDPRKPAEQLASALLELLGEAPVITREATEDVIAEYLIAHGGQPAQEPAQPEGGGQPQA